MATEEEFEEVCARLDKWKRESAERREAEEAQRAAIRERAVSAVANILSKPGGELLLRRLANLKG